MTTNIFQINLNRSPKALENHIAKHRKQHSVSLVQEPPLRKGSVHSIPPPLEILRDENPRAVIIYNPSLDIWPMPQYSNRDCQFAVWQINNTKVILGSVYWDIRSNEMLKHIDNVLLDLSVNSPNFKILIGIDSNAHHSNWGSPADNPRGLKLNNLITNKYNLQILNEGTEPTFTGGMGSSHIDVTIISPNLQQFVKSWKLDENDTFSDHKCLTTSLTFKSHYTRKIPDYRNVPWTVFQSKLLETNWSDISLRTREEVEEAVDNLTNRISNAINDTVPNIVVPDKPKRSQWWSTEIRDARRSLRVLYHDLRTSPSLEKENDYKIQRNNYFKLIKSAKFESWKERTSSLLSVAETSKLMNNILRSKSAPIGLTKKPDGTMTSTGLESIANLIHTHFPGITQHPSPIVEAEASDDNDIINDNINIHINSPSSTSWITEVNTQTFINKLEKHKAPGPDNIKNIVIKNLPTAIITHLTNIYTRCIELEFVPKSWLRSKTIFIKKSGKKDKSDPKSYRPICLSNTFFKIFEKHIQWYLDSQGIYPNKLTIHQHGFRHNFSTLTAISTVINYIELAQSVNEVVVAVFIDIQGAFDNIHTPNSLNELKEWGAPLSMVNTLKYYYQNRIVWAETREGKVEIHPAKGTAQGNVLSPMLWNIIVNQVGEIIDKHNIGGCLFADDIVLLARGTTVSVATSQLQKAINDTVEWANGQQLQINLQKTNSLCFSQNNDANPHYALFWGNHLIPKSDQTKYLGLHITDKLDWRGHFETVWANAKNQMVRIGKSLGKSWGPSPSLTLWIYKAIIRPKITYACHVWCHKLPSQWINTKSRNIQRWALKQTGPIREKTPTAGLEIATYTPPLQIHMQEISIKTIVRFYSINFLPICSIQGHLYHWYEKIRRHIPMALLPNDRTIKQIAPTFRNNEPSDEDIREQVSIYTDGSGIQNTPLENSDNELPQSQSFGSGFYMEWPHQTQQEQYHRRVGIYPNGNYFSVFLSEIKAITLAISHFLKERVPAIKVNIFTDCKSAIAALNKSHSSSITVQNCWKQLKALDSTYKWTITWVKGHSGIPGNEQADVLAKAAAKMSLTGGNPWTPIPQKFIHNQISDYVKQLWSTYWQDRLDCRQTKLWFPEPDPKKSIQLISLPREAFGLLTRWLTGHCYLARHNSLMIPEIEPICYLCQEGEETPWHLLNECPVVVSSNRISPEPWSIKSLYSIIKKLSFLEVPDYLSAM